MLIEFKVANYRSIRAEQTLSMVASNYSDELPQNLISCDHVPGLKGTKLVKAVSPIGLPAGYGPWLWGVLVWAIGLSLGGPTGYAMNPARDFGPRVAHALLPISGKGNSDWGYALVPVVGPLIAGGIGAAIIKAANIG